MQITVHLSGFTPRLLKPAEQWELLSYGRGITNVVAGATARADELSTEGYREGGRLPALKVGGCGRVGWPWWGHRLPGPRSATAGPGWARRSGPSGTRACGCCPIPAC